MLLVTYGRIFANVRRAAAGLLKVGIPVSVLKLTKIKPIEEECAAIAADYQNVLFFEEGIRSGGAGEAFGIMLMNRGFTGFYDNTAIDDFVPICTPQSGLRQAGLDAESIFDHVSGVCQKTERINSWARTV